MCLNYILYSHSKIVFYPCECSCASMQVLPDAKAAGQKIAEKAAADHAKQVVAKKTGGGWFSGWFSKKVDESTEEEKDPLVDEDGEANDKTEEQKQDAEDEEMKDMVNQLKTMTGMWDIDPPDSE